MKKHIKDYFDLSAFEIKAFWVLLFLILLLTALNFLMPYFIRNKKADFSTFESQVQMLTRVEDSLNSVKENNTRVYTYKKRFYFDPNTTDSVDWVRLGLKPEEVALINTFILEGNIFLRKSDLLRVPGFPAGLYNELKPYVFIRRHRNRYYSDDKRINDFDSINFQKIDLNLADSNHLAALTGVGKKIAARIVRYRHRLGGYNDYEQLFEVYGMRTGTVEWLYKQTFIGPELPIHKRSVNFDSKWQLMRHPYIDSTTASHIFEYRVSHGPFQSLKQLYDLQLIQDSVLFRKIEPYLKLW